MNTAGQTVALSVNTVRNALGTYLNTTTTNERTYEMAALGTLRIFDVSASPVNVNLQQQLAAKVGHCVFSVR